MSHTNVFGDERSSINNDKVNLQYYRIDGKFLGFHGLIGKHKSFPVKIIGMTHVTTMQPCMEP